MRAVKVAALGDLAAGAPRQVLAEGTPICLVRVGDDVHAIGDTCSHQGGPLSGGKLSGHRLACPRHGWMFDVRTGQCAFPPRGTAVPRYETRVEDDAVWVEIP
ncbi:MAG TPA: Rieske (2Fe-2S) protein [Terriglobales bacterium]|nr:Rieske (2Fe-2S) protein [Terriglobales bacterium]